MKKIITIDAGTTNTRAVLINEEGVVLGTQKREVGVRNTAEDGNNSKLKEAVRSCLETLLQEAGISWQEVSLVLASGMITSNVGLAEIPHLAAPAGAKELAAGITPLSLPDVCPLPIHFIPGIKNTAAKVTLENYEQMDIMRGEEVESVAMMASLPKGKPLMLVLPGSHTKFVSIDSEGKITGCLTSITGELLSVITHHTILADAVDRQFATEETFDPALLLTGYENARLNGLGRACFSCRILNQFAIPDKKRLASYLLGAVLQSDVAALQHSKALHADASTCMVVAGRDPLRRAICEVLTHAGSFGEVMAYESASDVPLACQGALLIAREGGLL